MTDERKIAVYLSRLDWDAVDRCLKSHVDATTCDGKVLWGIGRERVQYIREQIAAKLNGASDNG